jgi:hypothetical protein
MDLRMNLTGNRMYISFIVHHYTLLLLTRPSLGTELL